MAVRTKTRRRLNYIVICAVLFCIVCGAGYVLRKRYVNARVLRDRDAGYAALAREDYFVALNKIGPYVERHPTEVDALSKYALARSKVEEPNGKHLADAMSLYRRVLELQPDNAEARRQLLDLYVSVGFNSEILALTEGRSDPDSTRCHAIALARTNDLPGALADAMAYNDLKPQDLKMQMFTCELMARNHVANDDIIAWANILQSASDARRADPRFDLLLG